MSLQQDPLPSRTALGPIAFASSDDGMLPALVPPPGRQRFSDVFLRKWNLAAAVLHTVMCVAMVYAVIGMESRGNAGNVPLTISLTSRGSGHELVTKVLQVGLIPVTALVPLFAILTALAHGFVVSPWGFKMYIEDIDRGINRFRWYEYAVTSTLMIILIAMLCGICDLPTLLLIMSCNTSMCFFGFDMEVLNHYAGKVHWTPFNFGCWAGTFQWVVIGMYVSEHVRKEGQLQGLKCSLLISYAVCFNTFPANMALQYYQVGPWKDYRFGEVCFISLSLLAKSALLWLIFVWSFEPT